MRVLPTGSCAILSLVLVAASKALDKSPPGQAFHANDRPFRPPRATDRADTPPLYPVQELPIKFAFREGEQREYKLLKHLGSG